MSPPRGAIAIIGMGCFYPGAANLRQLWENVLSRRQQFRRLPERRLSLAHYFDPDPSVPDHTYARKAALIDGFVFDPAARRIPRLTHASTDVVHWLALEVAVAALHDTGLASADLPALRTGVLVGNTLTGELSRSLTLRLRWPFVHRALASAGAACEVPAAQLQALAAQMEVAFKSVSLPANEDSLAGALSNTIAGRICNFLNLRGGGYTLDGACASSMLAVHAAATALTCGDLDLALAGGVDVSIDPFELVGFAKAGALAHGQMRVFDRRACGFLPGEGCGFVVLKRLADAQAAGDRIYAVLRGWGVSSDGRGGGITTPSEEGQAVALRRAYERAGYGLRDISFIEGHGTGTPVGDRTELAAIGGVLEAEGPVQPRSCGMTSFKSIVGHTKAAAGIGGFIKAVLAVHRRVIPPTAGCQEPSESFARFRSVYPVLQGEIRPEQELLRAGVSAMGFGGINCHVTIESAGLPAPARTAGEAELDDRQLLASHQDAEVFPIGADSPGLLRQRAREVLQLAYGMSDGELIDLAAALAKELPPHAKVRAAGVVATPDQLDAAFNALADGPEAEPDRWSSGTRYAGARLASGPGWSAWYAERTRQPAIGYLFPGQGSQQLGMGRMLVERHEWARRLLAEAEHVTRLPLGEILFRPLDRVADEAERAAWEYQLACTETAQPAICLVSVLWLRFLDALGVRPTVVAGHSLGELSAFHAAGAFDARTLFALAAERGRAMACSSAASGAMAALACAREDAVALLMETGGALELANVNGPRQVVVAGPDAAIMEMLARSRTKGITGRRLPVSNAFHSRAMLPAAARLRAAPQLVGTFQGGPVELLSGMDGRLVPSGVSFAEYFANQVTAPVDFVSVVQGVVQRCELMLEVGPGEVIARLVDDILGPTGPACLGIAGGHGGSQALSTSLAALYVSGAALDWSVVYADRLVRRFVPAAQRQFIENPCERPFPGEVPFEGAEAARLNRIEAQPAQRRAVDEEGPLVDHRARMAVSDTDAAAASSAGGPPVHSVSSLVLDLIAARTGFQRETLSLDNRLLDDLNLDSIKAAELIAEAASRFGKAGRIEPLHFARATIRDVVESLESRPPDGFPASGAEPADIAAAAGWVREFAIEQVEEPLVPSQQLQEWAGARVLIVAAVEHRELPRALLLRLQDLGAKVWLYGLTEASAVSQGPAGQMITHLLLLMPSETPDLACLVEAFSIGVSLIDRTLPSTVAWVHCGGEASGAPVGADAPLLRPRAAAFAASVHLERPAIRVRAVDIHPALVAEAAAACLLDELSTTSGWAASGYDADGRRYLALPRLMPRPWPQRELHLSAADVALVTGGGRGITSECALALALATGIRLALIGTTPYPVPAPGVDISEVAGTLARARHLGVTAHYYCCDVTDGPAVEDLLAKVEREVGPVTVVVHGAARNQPRRAELVSIGEAVAELGPKVLGAVHLLRGLCRRPPRILIGLSSVIGHTGMFGNAWYGLSNELLEDLLRGYAELHPETSVLSVAFSVWAKVGMGARLGSATVLDKLGVATISPEEGARRFVDLVCSEPPARRMIVTGRLGDLDTWRPSRQKPIPARRFLTKVLRCEPGVETIMRGTLALEHDADLRDHQFRGAFLFPAVFGLEAMAEAVAGVLGTERLGPLCLENVRFEHPIAIVPGQGIEIEVYALVEEPADPLPLSSLRIRAGLRCSRTGFVRDHFSAIFVLNLPAAVAHPDASVPLALANLASAQHTPLDILPAEDLYGTLLFQGPRFQRLGSIYALNRQQCVFTVDTVTASASVGPGPMRPFLGDPLVHDAILQAPQLLVPQDECLPIAIERLELHRPATDLAGQRITAVALYTGSRERQLEAEVIVFDEAERVLMRLRGYCLQILDHHDDRPSAEELANPAARDSRRLRQLFDRASHALGLRSPLAGIAHGRGLHVLPEPERQELERLLLSETAAELAHSEQLKVEWLPSGRPELHGDDGVIQVGFAYDERVYLCVMGPGTQGCGLAAITAGAQGDAILGPLGTELVRELVAAGEPRERAAARILAAGKALRPGSSEMPLALDLQQRLGDAILFRGETSADAAHLVLTLPVRLTRGPERVLAVLVTADPAAANAVRSAFDPARHGITVRMDGPGDRPVLALRSPVTFRETSSTSRCVYFTRYFEWMGRLREVACEPVLAELVQQFAIGQWGLLTNRTAIQFYDAVHAQDVIEGRLWLARRSPQPSSMELRFEWWRVGGPAACRPVAAGSMAATWVAIRSPGTVEVCPLPDYLDRFLRAIGGAVDQPPVARADAWPDMVVTPRPAAPHRAPALAEQIFETSLEDANLVGNIYFASYAVWQGRLRDRFVQAVLARLGRKVRSDGELRAREVEIEHLREAMPFDRIAVRLWATALDAATVQFDFDYHRASPDGGLEEKLAFSRHIAVWYASGPEGNWRPAPLPGPLYEAMARAS